VLYESRHLFPASGWASLGFGWCFLNLGRHRWLGLQQAVPIGAIALAQRFSDVGAMFRQVPEQQRFLQAALFIPTRDMNGFAAERINPGVIDTGRKAPRGWSELLYLLDA
jgi:hypothetical protein